MPYGNFQIVFAIGFTELSNVDFVVISMFGIIGASGETRERTVYPNGIIAVARNPQIYFLIIIRGFKFAFKIDVSILSLYVTLPYFRTFKTLFIL